jgi:hypothetical protein
MQNSEEIPLTGPAAIYAALERINIEREEEEARKLVASGAKAKRKAAIKKLHVIQGLKRNDLSPKDLTISKVPVIPPVFRPFSLVGETFMPGDANELYRDLLRSKQTYEEVKEELGDEGAADAAYQLYNATKAVYGFSDPVNPKSLQRGVSGFMAHLTGKKGGPKFCYDDKTELLTEKGWCLFKDLESNVKVMTINPRTLKREWQQPTAHFTGDYEGDMHSFEGGAISLLVTPDHRMWVSKVSNKNNFGVVLAKDFPKYVRYRWQLDEDTFTSAEVRHTTTQYNGKIYCVTVPNKLVMVRRNGKVVISGNSVFQRRLFSKTMDSVGRGVITAGADLDMDEIGIPEDMAWKIYGPYIQRRLVQSGMSSMSALQQLADRSEFAKKALDKEISERPVVYSRAPAWHKYNVVAGWPKLHSGKNIQMNTFTTAGQGADFDGDAQVSTTLINVEKNISKNTENKFYSVLTSPLPEATVERMLREKLIPYVDTNTRELHIVDLEDFPYADFSNHVEGENGPIDFYNAPQGVKVVAYDEGTGKPVWADVSYYSKHYGRVVEIVETKTGKQIITDNDPRAVYGISTTEPDGSLARFTPTEALKQRVAVPVVRDFANFIKDEGAIQEIEITQEQECAFRTKKLDWNFGYLLGALCGDGWWNKRDYDYYNRRTDMHGTRSICLSDLRGFTAAKVEQLLRELDPTGSMYVHRQEFQKSQHENRFGDTVKYSYNFLHSELFTQFLDIHLGGAGDDKTTGSANKHLPLFFHQAPREFREGLICGLIDTDGTVCNIHGKGKPQLSISFTSTSLRLCREVSFLLNSLGVHSKVLYSKTTTKGNGSWLVSVSTVDSKAKGFFSGLQSQKKRECFINTPVTPSAAGLHDHVVLPYIVGQMLTAEVYEPKLTSAEREIKGPDIEFKMHKQNIAMQLRKGVKDGSLTRSSARAIIQDLQLTFDKNLIVVSYAKSELGKCAEEGKISKRQGELVRAALKFLVPDYSHPEDYKERCKISTALNAALRKGKISTKVCTRIVDYINSVTPYTCLQSSVVKSWIENIVENEEVSWSVVTGVQYTGVREDGYDLTVPGYETFMAWDGVILSNTINIHVPSLPESVKEAKERLFPSKMAFSIKEEDRVVPTLKHEQLLGLYTAKHRPSGGKYTFNSEEEALHAAKTGQIKLSDEVEIVPNNVGAYPKMARDSSYTPVVELLKRAKDSSDKGIYYHKHMILHDLTSNYPDEFDMDSDEGEIVGLTHRPSGFKIHTKKATLPANFLSRYSPRPAQPPQ